MKLLFSFLMLMLSSLFSNLLFAQDTTPAVGSQVSGNMDVMSLILSLLMVLALIVISAFVLKKFNLTPNHQSALKVITTLPLSAKEKLLVVQVGKKQLLLGVTAQQINLLETLDEPIEITKPVSSLVNQRIINFIKK